VTFTVPFQEGEEPYGFCEELAATNSYTGRAVSAGKGI